MDEEYRGLRSLLDKIPNDFVLKTMEKVCTGIFLNDKRSNFNYKKNFVNWADTHEAICDGIFYPSELPPRQKTQVEAISEFVQKGVQERKRIRGCGTRHSWGNIFSDPSQRLVAFYPYKVAKGTSQQLEEWALQMEA